MYLYRCPFGYQQEVFSPPFEILFLQSHFILVWSYQLMLMGCDLFMKYIYFHVLQMGLSYMRGCISKSASV